MTAPDPEDMRKPRTSVPLSPSALHRPEQSTWSYVLWTAVNALSTLGTLALLRSARPADQAAFMLWYQPLIPPLAMLWLWAVAAWHWESRRTRYQACFSADDARALPSSAEAFQVSSACGALATVSGMLYLWHLGRGETGLAALQPALLYGGGIAVLLAPGSRIQGEARGLLRRTLLHVALPIQAVSWSAFLMADISTSLSKAVGDGTRALCALGSVGGAAGALAPACSDGGWLVPAGLAAPHAIRLVQCLRVWRDTGARSQAWNALKYATAFPAIALWAQGRAADDAVWAATLRPLWLATAFLNTAYSYYWDLERDWEIGFFSQMEVQGTPLPRPVFSPPNMYPRKVYWYLMVSNLFLRFTWLHKLSDSLRINPLAASTFALLEVFRRFQWMFVRFEVELRKIQAQKPELGGLMGIELTSLHHDLADE